jgi:hypothetical protein
MQKMRRNVSSSSVIMMTAIALYQKSRETKYCCETNKPPKDRSDVVSFIVGGGTAGCITAYFQASWMRRAGIPGKVLLIDRGHGYLSDQGPSTKLKGTTSMNEVHSHIDGYK